MAGDDTGLGTRHQAPAQNVRYALQEPTLCGIAGDHAMAGRVDCAARAGRCDVEQEESLRRWARRRIVRLHEQLQRARKEAESPESLHQAASLPSACATALRHCAPFCQKRTQRWYQQATTLQTSIGAARDVMQAGALVGRLDTDRGLVEFLRGVAVGRQSRRSAALTAAAAGVWAPDLLPCLR